MAKSHFFQCIFLTTSENFTKNPKLILERFFHTDFKNGNKNILHEQMMEILQVEVVGYQINMVGPSQPTVGFRGGVQDENSYCK